MATAPSSGNAFGLHLSDRALTPILSSSQRSSTNDSSSASRRQSQALSTLTVATITAYDTASKLGLGLPQRVMIETHSSGPIVLTSYLHSPGSGRAAAEHARGHLLPLGGGTDTESFSERRVLGEGVVNGEGNDGGIGEVGEAENKRPQPPPLVAFVVASTSAEIGEARRAAARLERTGREFQREWVRKQVEDQEPLQTPTSEDD